MACIFQIHPMDPPLRERQGILQVCIVCALKNSYHTHPCATRYNAVTKTLTCVECQSNSILQVNLIGRVLYIANKAIVLSLCCVTPIPWHGDGHEWSRKCGPHCMKHSFQSIVSKRKKYATNHPKVTTPQCLLCPTRVVTHTRMVLNMRTKRMENVHFCNKHHPPVAVLNNVVDMQELEEFFDPSLQNMHTSLQDATKGYEQ